MNLRDNPEFYEQLSKPTVTSSSGGVDRTFNEAYISTTDTARGVPVPGRALVLIEGGLGATTGASDPRSIGAETVTAEPTPMNGPTREEIDAKLQAAEARTEARFVAIDGKLDRLGDRIESQFERFTEQTGIRFDDFTKRADGLLKRVNDVEKLVIDKSGEISTEIKSNRKWILWSVAALIFAALAAIWTTNNLVISAFTLGRETAVETDVDDAQPQRSP